MIKRPILIFLSVAFAGFASRSIQSGAIKFNGGRNVDTQSIARVNSAFAKVKTVCIGRFLIDVPWESTIVYGPARLPHMIERLPGKGEAFEALISERVAAINSTERALAYGPLTAPGSLLGQVLDGAIPNQKLVFGVDRATGAFYQIDSYLRVGKDVYVQSLSSPMNWYKKSVAELNEIGPLIKPRYDDEVPVEPGICIDGAFVVSPAKPIYEYVTLGVKLDQFDGVLFSMELVNKDVLVESDALEPRLKAAEKRIRDSGAGSWFDRIKFIRRGRRDIAVWKGFELLAYKPPLNDKAASHEFMYVSQGNPGDPLSPVLDIEFNTGVEGNKAGVTSTSLADSEATEIWDRLTRSIRVRPSISP